MIAKIEIICNFCGKKSEKNLSEINRQKKKGREVFYCNLNCAGKDNFEHLNRYIGKFNSNLIPNNRFDINTDFRWYMKNVIKNSKKKNQEYDLDMDYLRQVWAEQDGVCPFTKQKLQLRTHNYANISNRVYQASLDRIDSTKGYVKGNVRFVSLMFNYAKNAFSDEDVIEFCEHVTNNQKGSI
jgi:hypothetical protein